MGLESRYKELFGRSIRTEGQLLFEKNAVSIYDGAQDHFACEVSSEEDLHDSQFKCIDKTVEMYCDCTGVKNKPCAHLWAAILTAEKFEVFKDGAKRGVRLANTAASQQAPAKVVPIKSSPSPIHVDHKQETIERDILYILNGTASQQSDRLVVDLFWRTTGSKGSLKLFNPFSSLSGLSPFNKQMIEALSLYNSSSECFHLQVNEKVIELLKTLSQQQVLFSKLTTEQRQFKKITTIEQGHLELTAQLDSNSQYTFQLSFSGHSSSELLFISKDYFFTERGIYHTPEINPLPFVDYLSQKGPCVPAWNLEEFMETVILPSGIDTSHLPGRMKCERVIGEPRGDLFIRTALFKFRDKEQLHAELAYNYDGKKLTQKDPKNQVLDFYNGRILQRNEPQEIACSELLKELGFRFNESSHKEEHGWKLSPSKLPEVVAQLLRQNWIVVAEGKSYTAPKTFELKLTSGTDWFDLAVELAFENEVVPVAGLIEASKSGSHYVQLGDGSFGILPEEWLKYYTVLTQLGELVGDNLRFRKSQALIIEKLLSEKLEKDEGFKALTKSLENLSSLEPAKCHSNFQGKLRHYQQEGLAWLQFLEKTGFGGLLADDMGLGKTVQILALLQNSLHNSNSPALLVVPRSLIFNWQAEIQKFTPDLSGLVYTGSSRRAKLSSFKEVNIIITTYGTIRQDIETLVNYSFHYCILDEAQAIKNRDSSTAKALRLINATHRISMSGTPIENSLSDLLSQFEFLNPGMSNQGGLASLISGDDKLSKKMLESLKNVFKPFILRRTKKQVAKDLPEKVEQIIYCDMKSEQKNIYDNILAWYRQELSKETSPEAGEKKGIEFLGALTRLRQLACHPALVNEEWSSSESVKINVLIDRLKIIISEGHRVLIFSQFTSFLKLIQQRIVQEKWSFCYLDGATKDRKAEVDQFQNNPQIPLFLISLKAGGVGLNLTGADYVFIMDPWWNPAIENQAVDRAYRIGQTKQVMSCRLVCRETIEEKVLAMQRNKQLLADSLIEEDDGYLQKLTIDDFRSLLG
jgi:superfamily II DNA or RNA helicase